MSGGRIDVPEGGKVFFPAEGIRCWKNPKNRFFVFEIYMDANPAKKDPAYKKRVKESLPIRQYLQEYELNWDSFTGLPVYEDYNEKVHGVQDVIQPKIGLPLLRAWDFGLTPACVVAQYVEETLYVIDEYQAFNRSLDRFAPEVLAQLKLKYPEWADQKNQWMDFADPSGVNRDNTFSNTCFKFLVDQGLTPRPGPMVWEERRDSVSHFLTRRTKAGECFQISLVNCPMLARGFKGGYRYSDNVSEVEGLNVKPIKDEHSHSQDALQYICHAVRHIIARQTAYKRIPRPWYGFTGDK